MLQFNGYLSIINFLYYYFLKIKHDELEHYFTTEIKVFNRNINLIFFKVFKFALDF